jgi:4-hydroxy-tetrahydrodipicolinate synthase
MLKPLSLCGVIPPMCTPLTPDGEIDVASVHNLVDYLIEYSVHGIFVLGTTGEFPLLTDRQKRTLLDVVIPAVRGRVPVVVGILGTSTHRCIENGLVAKEAGADAVVLAATYYFRPSQMEVMDHFRAVHATLNLPVLAYDIPGLTNVKLEPATIKTLLAEDAIAGIKDSSGDLHAFREVLIATRGTGFRVFTGSELIFDMCLQMGAHGGVPGLGNVVPSEYVRIYELAMAGQWAAAARAQEPLVAFWRELISQGGAGCSSLSSALGGFKTALKLKGIIASSRVAAPFHSFNAEEEERVADVMRRHGFV